MWFLADRAIDLTADGRPDTVLLRAEGSASDSLLITVTFLVDGQEAWRTQWHSDHMLIDPPDFPDGELSRAAYVRQELTKAIESVTVSRFDESGYVHLADSVDSSLVRNPPAQQVSIAYGYETYLVLVWEAPQRQFSIVWGCC